MSHHHREMKVTLEELEKYQIAPHHRDYCAHLLIPLNKCRYENYYMPFKCVDERHAYEKCQYDEYLIRVQEMKEKKLESS